MTWVPGSRRRPALFRRLPWGRADPPRPPLSIADESAYPALAGELALLRAELVPALLRAQRDAERHQRRHRRQRVVMPVLAMLTAVGGAAQAAWASSPWPGVVTGLAAAGATVFTGYALRRRSLRDFQRCRRRAEALRTVYFRFLTGTLAGETELISAIARARSDAAAAGRG
ncbi:hypothetical protein J2S43_008171 [Catenuloplanes nepalensis]|uniref:SMODS and SLOG-associating 2TM effector domain-containing protein n=1 Tax=Catenuloplanes nepalensis TaxID=587533 RepID=A0ABT9N7H7_9ACTN|nr:DUF4231 domain-containing protein [Catenuloplanes nepalensis]MDP9799659.1 hypothetical protein [Catenuloplanes nepalensis]